jgi:C1A family cysteine protease
MKDYSQYKLNVKKSPYDPNVYKAKLYLKVVELPETFDMRDVFNAHFPVFDQGDQGSCAACAGTSMRQYQEFVDVLLLKKLSEQFVYNNREDLSEEGMDMQNLMEILYKVGICLNSLCDYGDPSIPSLQAYKDALKRLTRGYAKVNSIQEFKLALYTQGPCVIAVPVYNYGKRIWFERAGDEFLGGHALCCVGWTKDGFIIRNSWGDDWSDNGYTIMPFTDFNLIWEVWTAIDAPTQQETTTAAPETTLPPEPDKKSWWDKYWWTIAIGITVIGVAIAIIF